jgi:hypothetical protein
MPARRSPPGFSILFGLILFGHYFSLCVSTLEFIFTFEDLAMMRSLSLSTLLVLALALLTDAGDPSTGWLSYAQFTTNATDIITYLSADMVVPDKPLTLGGSPAFWFGIQTANGDGALVQPIMAKWIGGGFKMFEEIYDWTDKHDSASTHEEVQPGELISASVTYRSDDNSYDMNMTASPSGKVSNYNYKLLEKQTATESVAYFVLEHQPVTCGQLPANGIVSWRNIRVEVNGALVEGAKWEAAQEIPACGSEATVLDSTSIDLTWDATQGSLH